MLNNIQKTAVDMVYYQALDKYIIDNKNNIDKI